MRLSFVSQKLVRSRIADLNAQIGRARHAAAQAERDHTVRLKTGNEAIFNWRRSVISRPQILPQLTFHSSSQRSTRHYTISRTNKERITNQFAPHHKPEKRRARNTRNTFFSPPGFIEMDRPLQVATRIILASRSTQSATQKRRSASSKAAHTSIAHIEPCASL